MTDPTAVLIHGGAIEHFWEKHHQLREGEIFMEIGAFCGRYGVVAYRRGCSQIILVEPSPLNIATMKQVFKGENISDLSKIIVVEKAVSDYKGTKGFVQTMDPSGYRLQSHEQDFPNDSVVVQVDTLDGILDALKAYFGIDHVDLLGCDCENQEVNVIKYARRWLSEKRIRHVAIACYHQEGNAEQAMQILNEHGYKNVVCEGGDKIVFGDA